MFNKKPVTLPLSPSQPFHSVVFGLAFFLLAFLYLPLPGEETPKHPLPLTPEKTMEIFLNAFINKDIDTVMAYLPDLKTNQCDAWRGKMKTVYSKFMTPERHIKSFISATVLETKKEESVIRVTIEAVCETTPKFTGAVDCDDNGKCSVTLKWIFVQSANNTPWLFDGGGI